MVENNDFYSSDSPSISITGDEVQLEITNNRFFNQRSNAILTRAKGSIIISRNHFYGVMAPAIAVVDGGEATIRQNRLHDNWQGILVRRGGKVLIEENELYAQGRCNISISDNSEATITTMSHLRAR
jgi:hypothetical protein